MEKIIQKIGKIVANKEVKAKIPEGKKLRLRR